MIEESLEQSHANFSFSAGPLGGAVNAVASRESFVAELVLLLPADAPLPSSGVGDAAHSGQLLPRGSSLSSTNRNVCLAQKRMEAGFER